METKKSVVTAITENTNQWEGQNGTVYYHTITFANGDTGKYGSKSPKCEKFVIGQETEYEKETKVNGQYTNIVIKPVQAQQQGGGYKRQPKDEGVIIMLSCISSACNLFAQSSNFNDTAKVLATAEAFYNAAKSKSSKTN